MQRPPPSPSWPAMAAATVSATWSRASRGAAAMAEPARIPDGLLARVEIQAGPFRVVSVMASEVVRRLEEVHPGFVDAVGKSERRANTDRRSAVECA